MESLLGLLGCFATPVILLLALLVGGWIIYSQMTGAKKYQSQRQTKLSDLRKRGITAPATILSAKNGIVKTHGMFVSWGDRPEEVGNKIWVTYNLNDVTEMLFEYHDKDRKYYLGYPAFAKLEKQNIVIRKTGEEAIATILEVEDLELVHSYHKEMKSVLRLKLEVTPKAGEPFQAEAQNTFMNSGLHKYTVGKTVTVKFNSQDKTQVALV